MNHLLSPHLITDYVLDLLSPPERQRVEGHLVTCVACREAVQAERQVGQLVRSSVAMATRPGSSHLARLMPAPPTLRRFPAFAPVAWRPLMAVCVLAILFLGGFNLFNGSGSSTWQEPATAMAVTATSYPTVTATNVVSDDVPLVDGEVTLVPVPAGTPIASLLTLPKDN